MRPWPRDLPGEYRAEFGDEKPLHYWTGELVQIGDIVDIEQPHWTQKFQLVHGLVIGWRKGGRGLLDVIPIHPNPRRISDGNACFNHLVDGEHLPGYSAVFVSYARATTCKHEPGAATGAVEITRAERIALQQCDKIGHIPGLQL